VTEHLRVDIRNQGHTAIIALTGELDLASSALLEEQLETVARSESVIVDLRKLEFIDSTGLSVLVKAHQEAQESGRKFGLVRGSAQVQRLLGLTGLAERLTVADAPDDLLGDN
jgi:anti-sigma B factor antagonist